MSDFIARAAIAAYPLAIATVLNASPDLEGDRAHKAAARIAVDGAEALAREMRARGYALPATFNDR